jgi:hypothetical protein
LGKAVAVHGDEQVGGHDRGEDAQVGYCHFVTCQPRAPVQELFQEAVSFDQLVAVVFGDVTGAGEQRVLKIDEKWNEA